MSDRAGKQTSQYRYRFGDAVLIESEMELYIRDARTELEHRPTELLRVLLAHADETMTKDELLSLVWQGQTTVENVLPNAITKIRRALGEVLAARIVTVPRIGYRFEGPVERIASGRKYLSRLQLEQGAPVPLRQSFLLSEQLSERDGREVWRATHAKTGETRIFKFASSGLALASLKREVTLYRLMLGSLGERAPIVKIFDWNFENEPFFIESVDGGWDLANWHAGAPNLAKYSRSERLDLCIRIVEAVAQAHSAGVLHKDLKPSNIIISSERAPFLVDFGSGDLLTHHRLEQAQITPLGWTHGDQTQSLNSTPIYTAPEVFGSGQYSVLSDVYALGVIVYQIVAGDTLKPMAPGWEHDVDDEILAEDIAAATQSDPMNRLPTAQAFAERLRTIDKRRAQVTEARALARREAAVKEKLLRSRQRRPWLIATMASIIVGLLLSIRFAIDANDARDEAERRAIQAEMAREYLLETLYYTTPAIEGGETNEIWTKALERAESQLASLSANDPDAYAALSLAAGRIREGSGDSETAALHFENAADAYRRIESSNSPSLVESELRYAFNLLQLKRVKDAEPILERAVEGLDKIRTPRFELLFLALDTQASLAGNTSDYDQAKSLYGRQVEAYEQAADPKRRALGYRNDYDRWSRSRLHLAHYQALSGDPASARETVRPVLRKIDEGGTEINDHARLNALFMSASIALAAGEYEETISSANVAREIATRLYGPRNYYAEQLQYIIARSHYHLKNYERAANLSRDAIEVVCDEGDELSISCLSHMDLLATSVLHSADKAGAASSFETLLEHHVENSGSRSPEAMRARYFLAQLAMDDLRLEDAELDLSQIDFEALAESDRETSWNELGQATVARLAYLSNPSNDTAQSLNAEVKSLQALTVGDDEVSFFKTEVSSLER